MCDPLTQCCFNKGPGKNFPFGHVFEFLVSLTVWTTNLCASSELVLRVLGSQGYTRVRGTSDRGTSLQSLEHRVWVGSSPKASLLSTILSFFLLYPNFFLYFPYAIGFNFHKLPQSNQV